MVEVVVDVRIGFDETETDTLGADVEIRLVLVRSLELVAGRRASVDGTLFAEPAVSTSGSVRMPQILWSTNRQPKEAVNVKPPTATRPSACTPSWWKEPV